MQVLGIETSCDETGIAIYDSEAGLLGHQLYSQAQMHAEYGGVVPELASRDHSHRILPLVEACLAQAQLSASDLDAVAYTAGPGLMGALLVGSCVGRSLAWGWDIPAIAVHHLEGHLLAPMLETPAPEFPFVALLVSGGHSQLVAVSGLGQYQLLGESLDDAAGEAFDKTAKMLGLGYPGGPLLAKLAQQGQVDALQFPRPMTDRPGLDMSFSGLKTFALNSFKQRPEDEQHRANVATAFQQAVVDTLVIKSRRALQQTGLRRLVIAGGVSANQQLREQMRQLGQQLGVEVFYPRHEFCTDNGAMIALAGCLRLQAGERTGLAVNTRARWPLAELALS